MNEIPAWAMDDDSDDDDGQEKEEGDLEQGKHQQQQKLMEDFFREVDTIKADIDAITKASKEISTITLKFERSTTTADEQKLIRFLKPLICSTNKRAGRTKKFLELIKDETENSQTQSHTRELTKQFIDTIF